MKEGCVVVMSNCVVRIHRESVSGWGGFSLGGFDRVLYCKFKFGVQDSETLRAPLPRPLAVVKWYRINA